MARLSAPTLIRKLVILPESVCSYFATFGHSYRLLPSKYIMENESLWAILTKQRDDRFILQKLWITGILKDSTYNSFFKRNPVITNWASVEVSSSLGLLESLKCRSLSLTFRNWIQVLDDDKESAYSTVTPPTSDSPGGQMPIPAEVNNGLSRISLDLCQLFSYPFPLLPAPDLRHLMDTCPDQSHEFLFSWISPPV